MRRALLGTALLGSALVWAGTSIWQLDQSPTAEVFNGMSASSVNFAIGVGENGAIVHFVDGDAGTLVPSGTPNELFDVYVASPELAVATGMDVVLLWQGDSWSPLVNDNTGTVYTGTWISPEQDVVLYGSLGQFSFVCPHFPASEVAAFCRTFVEPMLAACGISDDIRVITTAGDIWRVDNFLVDIVGFDPIHDEAAPLGLTAVWAPEWACIPGPIEPLELFAIRHNNEFWRFDGSDWSNMNVAVPTGQTLTWLAGTGSGNIVAVGFESDGMGGNTGVVWHYDGQVWAEDSSLPVGTPGLTDVAASIEFRDDIFGSGFEDLIAAKVSPGTGVDILAAAEMGRYLRTSELIPGSEADISVRKTLLTPEPIRVGDRIEFQIVVQNIGPGAAFDFRFLDGYLNNIMLVTDNCGMSEFNLQAGWHYRDVRIPMMAAGDVLACTMEFDVVGPAGESIRNYTAIAETDEVFYRNNRSDIRDVIIQPPAAR